MDMMFCLCVSLIVAELDLHVFAAAKTSVGVMLKSMVVVRLSIEGKSAGVQPLHTVGWRMHVSNFIIRAARHHLTTLQSAGTQFSLVSGRSDTVVSLCE